jgi:hypothetical protein
MNFLIGVNQLMLVWARIVFFEVGTDFFNVFYLDDTASTEIPY